MSTRCLFLVVKEPYRFWCSKSQCKCSIARIPWIHELQYYVFYMYNVNWFCKEVMILWEPFSFDVLMFFIAF